MMVSLYENQNCRRDGDFSGWKTKLCSKAWWVQCKWLNTVIVIVIVIVEDFSGFEDCHRHAPALKCPALLLFISLNSVCLPTFPFHWKIFTFRWTFQLQFARPDVEHLMWITKYRLVKHFNSVLTVLVKCRARTVKSKACTMLKESKVQSTMMKRKARGVEGGRGHSRHLKRGHLDSKHAPDSSRYFHFKSFEYLQNLPKLAKSRFVKDTVTLTGSSNTTWLNFKISATTGPNNQQILPTGQIAEPSDFSAKSRMMVLFCWKTCHPAQQQQRWQIPIWDLLAEE